LNEFPECEGLNAHRKRICRGERPDLNRVVVNRYREAWGFAPLTEDILIAGPNLTVAPVGKTPSLFRQVVTFAAALTNHLHDGMAKCDEADVQARLQVCQKCPSFTGTHCRECGCGCSGDNTFFNKLSWRSEKCPLGQW
jgi:hypothetical protein